MNRRQILFLTVLLAVSVTAGPLRGQLVTMEEAETIATNWVALTINLEGRWGDFEEANISEVNPLEADGDLIG